MKYFLLISVGLFLLAGKFTFNIWNVLQVNVQVDDILEHSIKTENSSMLIG